MTTTATRPGGRRVTGYPTTGPRFRWANAVYEDALPGRRGGAVRFLSSPFRGAGLVSVVREGRGAVALYRVAGAGDAARLECLTGGAGCRCGCGAFARAALAVATRNGWLDLDPADRRDPDLCL